MSPEIDDVLDVIGGYGRFQILVQIILFISALPQIFQAYMMVFAGETPNWKCSLNSTQCNSSLIFSKSNNRRCYMDREAWTYAESKSYSVVADFDLDCENHWMVIPASSSYFIGNAVGSFFLSWIADNFGRISVILPCVTGIAVVGIVSAFSVNIWMLAACRFINGILASGGSIIMMTLIAELVISKFRALAVQIICTSGSVGLFLLATVAYFIQDWKKIALITSAPFLLILPFIRFVPESMHWLLTKGKVEEVRAILRRVSIWNRCEADECIQSLAPLPLLKKRKTYTKDLFSTKILALRSTIISISVFVISAAYYSASMAADKFSESLYLNYWLVAIVEIPSPFVVAYVINKFGRKSTIIFASVVGSLLCFAVAFLPVVENFEIMKLCAGCLAKFFISIAYHGIFTWTAEIYPTILRAQGTACCYFGSKLGGSLSPFIAQGLTMYHKALPFALVGGSTLMCIPLLSLLPETKRKRLGDGDCDLDDRGVIDDDMVI